jgi:hypothetical protein
LSIDFNQAETSLLVGLLSHERLHGLLQLTGSEAAAIDLHQQTLGVSGDLMRMIATTEIALRNAIALNLGRHFGVPNWLQQPPVSFQWRDMERKKIVLAVDSAKRAEYSKYTQAQKASLDLGAYPNGRPPHVSHLQRAKARRNLIGVTEGKVIAELTFHFWKRLFSSEYEQTLWRPSLKRVFPKKTLKRAHVAAQLEIIYQARNRLAHHEPVLHKRFRATVDAVSFVAGELGAVTGTASPLAKLLETDIARAEASEAALSIRLDAFRSS